MSTLKVNTIAEQTAGNGVTIDGLLLKDGGFPGSSAYFGTPATAAINFALTLNTFGNVAPFMLGINGRPHSGTIDDMLVLGYNVAGDGSKLVAGVPHLYMSMEADYNNAGDHAMEWNLDYYGGSGVGVRPWYFVIERADAPAYAAWQYRIGQSTDGKSYFQVQSLDTTEQYLQITPTDAYIKIATGTSNYFRVMNQANGIYFQVNPPGKVTIYQDLILTRTSPGAAVQFSDTARLIVPTNKVFNFSADGGVTQHVVLGAATLFNAATTIGFFGHAAVAQQTKAGHNNWAALGDVVSALVNLGLLDAA